MENNTQLISQCTEKAQQWLTPAFDQETQASVRRMLENEDKTDLIECFYRVWNWRITRHYGSRQ